MTSDRLPRRGVRLPGHHQHGFTVIELLAASLLTLLFFGWLTSASVTVTRATLAWQVEWAVAAETQRAVATLTRDVERAVILEGVSPSGVTLTRTDGRTITYAQRPDGVYRNEQKMGGLGVTLTALQLTGLWACVDSVSGQRCLTEVPPGAVADTTGVPPAWLRIVVVGQAKGRTSTAQTLVRLSCQRPALPLFGSSKDFGGAEFFHPVR